MTYFKQYGLQRTGTNYLRFLIEDNFLDTHVFMSILGWKHSLFNNSQDRWAKNAEEWIEKFKCSDSYVEDLSCKIYPNFKINELKDIANSLNYLISIKPLIPWIYSVKNGEDYKYWSEMNIEKYTNQYFAQYDLWLNYVKNKNFYFVNHFDLLKNKELILNQISKKFNLSFKYNLIKDTTNIVLASVEQTRFIHPTDYDKNFYLNEEYLKYIPIEVVEYLKKFSKKENELFLKLGLK